VSWTPAHVSTPYALQCTAKKITPRYTNIKVPYASKAAQNTQRKVNTIRIKDEIKFLDSKKEHLNKELNKIHLKAAQEWGNTWHIIQQDIHKSISKEMAKKYDSIKLKLNKLVHTQTSDQKHVKTFFPRAVNNTNIKFTTEELKPTQQGPQI
jgi:hypothetical protein